jgi:hypothetical protein
VQLTRRTFSRLSLFCVALLSIPVLAGCDPSDDPVLYKPTAGTPVQFVAEPTEPRTNVSIAQFNSIVHKAWVERRTGMSTNTVKYSFSGIGTGFADNINNNTIEMTTTLTGVEDVFSPKVVVGPVGEVTVVWAEGVLGSRSIAFATKPVGSNTFGPVSYMIRGDSTTPEIDHNNPDAHYDDNGALHVVWEAGSNIMYRQRPLSGTLANAITLDAVGSGNPFTTPSNPSVMTDESENVVVAFEATQSINGSPRRVIRVAASDNGGGSFNGVGVLGGAGQQIVAGLYEPKLFRVPGPRQFGAVIRKGNERQRKIQSAVYVNFGASIVGSTINELVDDEAPVGQVSSVRSPRVASYRNTTKDTTEVYAAWAQGGEVLVRVSTSGGNSYGEAVSFSTGAGVAGSALRPSIAAVGDWLTLAWDGEDTVNGTRAIFINPTNVANRYDPPTP